jgi:hypothetical protein
VTCPSPDAGLKRIKVRISLIALCVSNASAADDNCTATATLATNSFPAP